MKVWSIFTVTLALLLAAGALGADGAGSSASTAPSGEVKQDTGLRHHRADANPQDWPKMLDFMKTNSPNRYKVLNDPKFKKDSPLGNDLMSRWQDYRQLNDNFPDLGKVREQRFSAEDQLYGVSMQLKKDPTQVEALRPKIHDICAQLISLDIQDRQLRIKHLQDQQDKEQKALDDEKQNADAQADAQAQKIIDGVSKGGGHHGQHRKNPEPGAGTPASPATPDSGDAPQSRPSGDSTGN